VGTSGFLVGRASASDADGSKDVYDFHGEHQAGIVTPVQDRVHFAAFDVLTEDRDELIQLLKDWTAAAASLTKGGYAGPTGATDGDYEAPPEDTGETIGLPASGLTITFGFGPTLFEKDGVDRFGIASKRPKLLERLPHFPADNLQAERSDGDLCVQACADDPQVAVHAVRNLARIAFGVAAVRWSQLGFGRTSSTTTTQETPRNLFGFKDGTANLKAEDPAKLTEFVWVQKADDSAAEWLANGSYLIARRINMTIEPWDRTSLREQEQVVGRSKQTGAPLSGGDEFTTPNFELEGRGGPVIDVRSHVRLAHPSENDGAEMLRRGYNFTDGTDGLGRLDAGLFFIAFVRNPKTQYIPMQTRLSRDDLMMEYLQHRGSAIFAVPPGIAAGGYVGSTLFA
jgi:deferrochelatase/peroxidase EfeB